MSALLTYTLTSYEKSVVKPESLYKLSSERMQLRVLG